MSKRKKTVRRRSTASLSPAQRAASNLEAGKVHAALAWARSISNSDAADDIWIAGKILATAGETAQAIQKLERLREIDGRDQEVNFVLACCYATVGEAEKALATADVRRFSEDSLLSFASCLQRGDADQAALKILESGLESRPQSVAVSVELARTYSDLGDLQQAKKILVDCVELPVDSVREKARAWFNLGDLLERMHEEAEATKAYQNAISTDESYTKAWINLAVSLINAHQHPEAIESLTTSTEKFPENDRLNYLYAFTLRLDDKFEQAIRVLRKIVDRSANAPAWELLGRLLTETGDADAAIRHYKRWLSVQPRNPVAGHMLASLSGEEIPGRASASYVTTTFDAFAETFESALMKLEYCGPAAFAQILDERLQAVEPASLRVLDAGCGTGLIGPVLQKYASELVGVDLSSAMLAKAKLKGVYGKLVCEDLEAHLKNHVDSYDLIAASDTFNYFGDLSALFDACFAALKHDGWLVFSVEEGPLTDDKFFLQHHGRFVHSPPYIMEQLGERGIAGGSMNRVVLRKEADKAVHALLVAVQRPE